MKEDDIQIRDWFAGLAMREYMTNLDHRLLHHSGMDQEDFIAVQAYMMADAMLQARKDEPNAN